MTGTTITDDVTTSGQNPARPSRRTVLGAAAWAAPAITVVAASPAVAASAPSGATLMERTNPSGPAFAEDTAASRVVSVSLYDDEFNAIVGATVIFTLSSSSWLRFTGGATSAAVTTDANGTATTSLTVAPGAAPTPGDTVTLLASHQALSESWTITYRPFTAISTGPTANHVLAISSGAVYAWGAGGGGQLGVDNQGDYATPVAVITTGTPMAGKTITAVATGDYHSLALASDGNLYAWGSGSYGKLGTGNTSNALKPVRVNTSRRFTAISAGPVHNLAVATDGTVHAWGSGGSGQLGNGGTASSSVPVAVTTTGTPMAGKTITAVANGAGHSLALDSEGSVYSWGSGAAGALGNGASTDSTVPVLVTTAGTPMADKVVTAIATGFDHSLALTSDGTVYAWGNAGNGRLGDGTGTGSSSVPVLVDRSAMGTRTIVAISAGSSHNVAAASDGSVYAWGFNGNGQLGNGTTTRALVPVVVTSTGAGNPLAGAGATAVTAGYSSSWALTSTRLTASWGQAALGRLGNGTITPNALVPVKVLTPR
ncbi:RCC1 domain-containing protein [Nocardioides plantarum]|uniref:RCC1 domain-containing protein n=1 Tax=Nocardioides plantarum TaxID=29299 RepID=A0ABV5K4V2_9ACTN|nr:hypothetical protein [Nocardioides plantarum]